LQRIDSNKEIFIKSLNKDNGTMFGHISAFLGSRSNFSVLSQNYSTTAALSRDSF
jgi:hypothetical protein